jgi:hypothetical protein
VDNFIEPIKIKFGASKDDRLEIAWLIIEEAVHRASLSVAPIWVTNWGSHKYFVVGTGFIIVHEGKFYFVTASHVLDLAFQYKEVRINLFGRTADLHGLYFVSCPISDISVTRLPEHWLSSRRMDFRYAPSTSALSSDYEATEEYVMAGFPASINKLDVRWPSSFSGAKMMILGARLHVPLATRTTIPNPISVCFDHKKYKGKTPPALQGLSGGPLYQITRRDINKNGENVGLGVNPVGVLCEWHKRERTVVAVKISVVVILIEDRFRVWDLAGSSHAGAAKSLELWTPNEMVPPFPIKLPK